MPQTDICLLAAWFAGICPGAGALKANCQIRLI